jgi:hypothetical protein
MKRTNRPSAPSLVWLAGLLLVCLSHTALAKELHVSKRGSDTNIGSQAKPLKTISAAAQVAQPGDVITVHQGTYRERITPPRGGESDARRIVYQAADGEEVVIKGSEVVTNWEAVQPGIWKATVPNELFGEYNPYQDQITGDWFANKGRVHHTGDVYLNGKSLWEMATLEQVIDPQPVAGAQDQEGSSYKWCCESDEQNTYIYANFHDQNPRDQLIEINVRDSCIYPAKPGCNYITIRGFRLCHAATQWAAPTAEQIGLIGTHWSKGWIIEDNVISDSRCSGITLGKDRKTGHNVWSNNPEKDGATHYNEVIVRALKAGWSREEIGSHIVRNNVIFNCEQTGICGSLGPAFSQITDNHIYNIWTKRQFAGAEMGGIKLHAAIDVLIKNNRIHNTGRGLWMDWMAQGTRITSNLLYDNTTDDLFVEVNHGPFLVDNNLFLSQISLRDWSEGGAYAHNLMTGRIVSRPELRRSTPYQQAHSTQLAGLANTRGGDNRFYNNVFVAQLTADGKPPQKPEEFGLAVYKDRPFPLHTGGNVYLHGARPGADEPDAIVLPEFDAQVRLQDDGEQVHLLLELGSAVKSARTRQVTTELLGKTEVAKLPYENADGSPIAINYDYFSQSRDSQVPTAGPFENVSQTTGKLRVWPIGDTRDR